MFVDFKSAYDLVSRNILIQKLLSMKIPKKIVQSIRDFLCQRFISVRYQGFYSSYKQVKRGLPLGSISSTTLFNIMINDLCQTLKKIPGIEVVLNADDLAIIFSNQNKEEIEKKLNKALESLNEWTVKNEMVINQEKTKFQIFSMSNTIKTLNLKLNGTSLLQGESPSWQR